MHIKHHNFCRGCGNPNLQEILNLGEMHFQGCFKKDGVSSPPKRKMPNVILRCDTSKNENACGLIQTKHSVSPEILYRNYWYESGISFTMRSHLQNIVKQAVEIKSSEKIKYVLDIASNDNTLLRSYRNHEDPSNSSIKKYGVDPSNVASKQNDKDIFVINETFPTKKLTSEFYEKFDIITSIACFYDVNEPDSFIDQIKRLLSYNGIWIFEVAYWPTMLEKIAYDSCVNEHVIHYHLAPLEFILKKNGMKIFKAEKTPTNGGSILCFVCKSECEDFNKEPWQNNLKELRLEEFDARLDEQETYYKFNQKIESNKSKLVSLLKEIVKSGKTIHIYGSSTKLNTILGYCDIGPDITPYAAERSPNKIGAETLSGIKIISEEQSRSMKPDYYLVGPYHFKNEILLRESEAIKNGVKFIFPLPDIEVYPC